MLQSPVGPDSWSDFQTEFQNRLQSADVVGYKTICAYRTGLSIQCQPSDIAQQEFSTTRQQALAQKGSFRLENKPIIDALVCLTLDLAAKLQRPVQFHTGFGKLSC